MYDPGFDLRIVGPDQDGLGVDTLLAGQMGPNYFPLPYERFRASLSFRNLREGIWEDDGIRVRAFRVRHSSYTVGYRIEAMGRAVAFIPDNEVRGGPWSVPETWFDDMDAFVAEADLLIHDSMFTDEEYNQREGWGHSTFTQTLELAERAGVKNVSLFHHAPFRSDEALGAILDDIRREVEERGSNLGVEAASEGTKVVLDGREGSE
jgi:ribonuclease BN (tRNA processing enzyme)